jgi:hypothetical protein
MKKIKAAWALQSFLLCILFNGIFAVLIFLMADKVLEELSGWVSPFLGSGGTNLQEDMRSALNNLGTFAAQMRQYLMPGLAALASAVTLLLWFFLFLFGERQITRATKRTEVACSQQGGIRIPVRSSEDEKQSASTHTEGAEKIID